MGLDEPERKARIVNMLIMAGPLLSLHLFINAF